MIVLDTNVVSEPIRARPDVGALHWLGKQDQPLAVTSITIGELLVGVHLLPQGQRRRILLDAVESVLLELPLRLPFDDAAARAYALLQERARSAGRPLAREDGMIAGICLSRGVPLATRNTRDFEHLPIDLVNPWRPDQGEFGGRAHR
ncbi:MAG: type II toxin-antitoxin system VapC family toxin [Bifidobacteriaceae bacterium]|nr:type II toxin-antitoxin system VapC family toxin [Bifidobacteriaceae bacterium]